MFQLSKQLHDRIYFIYLQIRFSLLFLSFPGRTTVWQRKQTVRSTRRQPPVPIGAAGCSQLLLQTIQESMTSGSVGTTFWMWDQKSASLWAAGQMRLCTCRKIRVSWLISSRTDIVSIVCSHSHRTSRW